MSDFEILLNETGTLSIRNLEITNKEVIDFIQSFKEEEKETKIVEILEFGVKAMKSFLTESYGKLIDSHFQQGTSSLERIISNQIATLTNDLKDRVMTDFIKMIDEKKEDIDKKVLESFKDDLIHNVFKRFNEDFNETTKKLEASLLKYVVKEGVEEETIKKGIKFEDYVYELTNSVASYFGDTAEHIGPDNKSGDILVKNDNDGIAFAIEVRHRHKEEMTEPMIMETFKDVERVRQVQFSMIVVNNEKEIPQKVSPFRVYGLNRMVVSLSSQGEEDFMPYIFRTAYRIMRFLALTSKTKTKEIDIKGLKDKINSVRRIIHSTSAMKSKITKFSTEFNADLDKFKQEIEDILEDIESILD